MQQKYPLFTACLACFILNTAQANITEYQYEYDLDNKLINLTPPANKNGSNAVVYITYDANGNMLKDGLGNIYTYDLENELISYTNKQGHQGTYTYYPNTMRATKQVNEGNPITFYYNGDKYAQIVNEAQPNSLGLSYTSYAMLGNNRYVRLVHDNSSNTITKQYLIKDNKNVIAKLGSTGKIDSSYVYNPYGTQVNLDQTQFSHSNQTTTDYDLIPNPFGYESEYKDNESGLIYLRARYYSPQLMRFISRDTADLPNRYQYANGNPISNSDPSGHDIWNTLKNPLNLIQGAFKLMDKDPISRNIMIGVAGAALTAAVPSGAAFSIGIALPSAVQLGNDIQKGNNNLAIGDALITLSAAIDGPASQTNFYKNISENFAKNSKIASSMMISAGMSYNYSSKNNFNTGQTIAYIFSNTALGYGTGQLAGKVLNKLNKTGYGYIDYAKIMAMKAGSNVFTNATFMANQIGFNEWSHHQKPNLIGSAINVSANAGISMLGAANQKYIQSQDNAIHYKHRFLRTAYLSIKPPITQYLFSQF